MSKSKNIWNYLGFAILTALWGGSFIAIKFAVIEFPPIFSAFLRVGIAQISLIFIVWITKSSITVERRLLWKMWFIGLFPLGIPFAFLFWGERFISPGLAGILCATMPIWTLILSLIFLPYLTTFSFNKLMGLLLGLFGVCIVFWPLFEFHAGKNEILGSIAVILMAVSYAIGALLNQQFSSGKHIPIYTNVFHQNLSSTVFLLLVSLCLEKWPSAHTLFNSSTIWIASIYLGVFSTAIAWILYFRLIHEWGAIRASTATYVAPVMAIVWDFLFFRNYPTISMLLGISVILGGVFLIQSPKKG